MTFNTGASAITDVHVGSTAATAVYVGDKKVWPAMGSGFGSFLFSTGNFLSTESAVGNIGGNDFTAELFVKLTTNSIGYQPILANMGTADYQGWIMCVDASNRMIVTMTTTGTPNWTHVFYSAGPPPVGTWIHLALVRNGTNVTLYMNGVAVGNTTFVGVNHQPTGGEFFIGNYRYFPYGGVQPFHGNMSNIRIVVGKAVYTADFTPPTSTLMPIPGTTLLTCNDPKRIFDDSPAHHPVTIHGGAVAVPDNPFTP